MKEEKCIHCEQPLTEAEIKLGLDICGNCDDGVFMDEVWGIGGEGF